MGIAYNRKGYTVSKDVFFLNPYICFIISKILDVEFYLHFQIRVITKLPQLRTILQRESQNS